MPWRVELVDDEVCLERPRRRIQLLVAAPLGVFLETSRVRVKTLARMGAPPMRTG
jgi:hypothetical protein